MQAALTTSRTMRLASLQERGHAPLRSRALHAPTAVGVQPATPGSRLTARAHSMNGNGASNGTGHGTGHGPSVQTLSVHGGEDPRVDGAAVTPIFQSATFLYSGNGKGFRYTRNNNNPNQLALGVKLALLEGSEAALALNSGMSAISSTLTALLGAGDHMLIQGAVYGATYELVHNDLKRLGIEATIIDEKDPTGWDAALRPNTKVIYVEAIGNPLIDVPALPDLVAFARRHGLTSIIDATFATPVNLRPIQMGFDVVVHSATKYLNGHSDVIAGVVATRKELADKIRVQANHFGGSLDPHAAFLLQRGIKTLALRVRQQNANALALAKYLDKHPKVAKVFYPGLPSHPQHELVKELFIKGGAGGVLSFELHGGAEAADSVLASLKLALVAVSLGGVETLVTRPAATTHASMSADQRAAVGIGDALVRVACGIEDSDDLIADFAAALEALPAAAKRKAVRRSKKTEGLPATAAV